MITSAKIALLSHYRANHNEEKHGAPVSELERQDSPRRFTNALKFQLVMKYIYVSQTGNYMLNFWRENSQNNIEIQN